MDRANEYTLRQRYIWRRIFGMNDYKQRFELLPGGVDIVEECDIRGVINRMITQASQAWCTGLTWDEALPMYEATMPNISVARAAVYMLDLARDLVHVLRMDEADLQAVRMCADALKATYGTVLLPEKAT